MYSLLYVPKGHLTGGEWGRSVYCYLLLLPTAAAVVVVVVVVVDDVFYCSPTMSDVLFLLVPYAEQVT